jgi:hypothetical protein
MERAISNCLHQARSATPLSRRGDDILRHPHTVSYIIASNQHTPVYPPSLCVCSNFSISFSTPVFITPFCSTPFSWPSSASRPISRVSSGDHSCTFHCPDSRYIHPIPRPPSTVSSRRHRLVATSSSSSPYHLCSVLAPETAQLATAYVDTSHVMYCMLSWTRAQELSSSIQSRASASKGVTPGSSRGEIMGREIDGS